MKKYLRRSIPIIFALSLFCLAIWVISTELRHYSLADMANHWNHLPLGRKLGAIALTGVGYFVMTGYDRLGFHYLRRSLSGNKVAFTAFISYAIGNTVGFTALSGTAIRYRFYGNWGVAKASIAKLVVFTHFIFWLGLFSVSGIVFLIDPLTLPTLLHLPFDSVRPLGGIFLLLVMAYLITSIFWTKSLKIGKETLDFPSLRISLAGIGLSALDWGLAAGVLYLLFPHASGLSYFGFFGIYILALTAGLISNIPGGLGVFETVILGLKPANLSSADVLGALIAYRGIYYLLPLSVALFLLPIQLWVKRRH